MQTNLTRIKRGGKVVTLRFEIQFNSDVILELTKGENMTGFQLHISMYLIYMFMHTVFQILHSVNMLMYRWICE